MVDAASKFFDRIGRHGYAELLKETAGTLRFDLDRGDKVDHWLVSVDRGRLRVQQGEAPASCVVKVAGTTFDRIVTGEVNAIAAWTRHELVVKGDLRLMQSFERVFPGPPQAQHPATFDS